jgi:hypothetical protein
MPRASTVAALWCALFALGATAEVLLQPLELFDFTHQTGARGERWLPETMGSGVIVADLDSDGRLDLLFLDGQEWGGADPGSAARLFLGQEGMRFRETFSQILTGQYAFGGAAADFDADKNPDLIITTLEGAYYLRGHGDGHFDEGVLVADGWCTSVALLDFDADGRLDAFVGRYVDWSPEKDLWCTLDGEHKSYCTPEVYAASNCIALHNLGDGRFEAWPHLKQDAKALGVVAADLDDDGWTDVIVASDTTPDLYYVNQSGRGFVEAGLRSGMALSSTGRARGGMGVDVADLIPGDGLDLAVGHFAGEAMGFYRNGGEFGFLDEAQRRGLDAPTRAELTFGLLALDLDLDGDVEVVTANGHIEPEIHLYRPGHRWKQRLGVYSHVDENSFAAIAGAPQTEWVGRGLAHGDFDGDGDADLILTQNAGTPVVLENRSPWDRVIVLRGLTAGTTAWLQTDRRLRRDDLRVGNSYLSCSEAVLRFGLGADEHVVFLELIAPGNKRRRIEIVDDGRRVLEVTP